jgi:hypothetical protein
MMMGGQPMPEMTQEMREQLHAPFPVNVHFFKPQAVSGERALGLPYVDPREYAKRLDDVDPAWSDEYDVFTEGNKVMVLCRLTVGGITRQNGGECALNDDNAFTSALAQAFKRACAKHGLGRYLYAMPKTWADYDPRRKRFTDRGMRQLKAALSSAIKGLTGSAQTGSQPSTGAGDAATNTGGADDGADAITVPNVSEEATQRARAVTINFGKYVEDGSKSVTLGEIFDQDRQYVTGYLAQKANDQTVRAAAMYLAQLNGHGNTPDGNGHGGNGHNGKLTLQDALSVTMPFGTRREPHLKGKTLKYVEEHNDGLVDWLTENAKSPRLREAAEVIVASRN